MSKLILIFSLLIIGCNKSEDKKAAIDEKDLPPALQNAAQRAQAKAEKYRKEKNEPHKIIEAFGIELGNSYKLKSINEDNLYTINPPTPNRVFSEYKIYVTPTTNIVYGITARGQFDSNQVKSEFGVLKSTLENKYGKFELDINLDCEFIHRDRKIKIDKRESSIILTYFDFKLNKLANEETIKIKSKNADSPGL